MRIRDAETGDADALWALLEPVYRGGETYAVPRDVSREDALRAWLAHPTVRVAEGGSVLGSYYLGPNLPGPGAHVANAGFVVSGEARGRGVGRAMAEESLRVAREQGFAAMQFNCVVSTNPATVLWESLGFAVVGRVPDAFEHPVHGRVDTLVMHRWL